MGITRKGIRRLGIMLAMVLAVLSFSPHEALAQSPSRSITVHEKSTSVAQVQRGLRTPEQFRTNSQKDKEEEEEAPTPYPFADPILEETHPTLITQFVALTLMALAPFLLMLLTSFIKVVVVLSLLRSALGAQQAPPNQVINGVALLISIYIMFPTGVKMYDASYEAIEAGRTEDVAMVSPKSAAYIIDIAKHAQEPLREWLRRNSSIKHQKSFFRTVYRTIPEDYRDTVQPTDFLVLVPSYITSQLKDAFEIGVLIYIPFFVIDLVTANILLAMGMMMLSPVTISMPLKLFLLVMLDGWTLLIQGLVTTFQN